ncbi:phosphate signaling complex protein PhoU [Blastopirellula sp. JC732]|uniref:Phosphate-specific transport system accessory protein PhoU n=1 Tax=Blastopirellula sediminis TaxID=2894196 RepID=A0A9X1MQQ9_9BACT|nr:phosphate signaling complex protein PhoU [Blastopirellula sediminis]MCC9606056.1 phosphate signaling complex protein PhoU [Blastopirellula sediminis]MCC9630645.1 phosphate signaling complex protein PhoU [Blastopirellula sediminis]
MTVHFEKQLDQLRRQLVTLGAMVEEHVRLAIRAAEEQDRALAQEAIDRDDEVDALQMEISEESLHLVALFQPVASDLRFVISVQTVINELERIGDHAHDIGQGVLRLIDSGAHFDLPPLLQTSKEASIEMLRQSLDALLDRDAAKARDVILADDTVDQSHRGMYDWFKNGVRQRPDDLDWMMEMLTISRHVERIADHATNIAETVVYLVEGELVRRGGDRAP